MNGKFDFVLFVRPIVCTRTTGSAHCFLHFSNVSAVHYLRIQTTTPFRGEREITRNAALNPTARTFRSFRPDEDESTRRVPNHF